MKRIFESRDLVILRIINSTPRVIENRIVMDYAVEFTINQSEKERKKELRDINYVRIVKGILLLFKLVRVNGRDYTNAYLNNKEQSAIE